MKVVVTGGAGYIGSVVTAELLNAGHRVRVLDALLHGGKSLLGCLSHPNFELCVGDVRNAGSVSEAVKGAEAVVHLAAVVGDPACKASPELACSINVNGSLRVFEAARRAHAQRFIFISTCSNYGRSADADALVNEASPLQPLSLYAQTKVAMEDHLLRMRNRNGMCATVLRLATVYGASPRLRLDLTVNDFTAHMVCDRRLTVYGEKTWRPYVHVRDVARAIDMFLRATPETVDNEVFNVGDTEQNFRKLDIVELARPHAPDAQVQFVNKADDPRDYRVSFDKLKAKTGFRISRSVPDGVQEIARLVSSGIVTDIENPAYRNC